ncbi:hypothetical protein KUCAC02_032468 [Chaenocephalus aceratus]|nr:hypothetical protein KUCAC02_032468 [Chaenocephalus aceratus]
MDAQNDDLFSDMVAVYVQFISYEGSPNTEFLSLQRLGMPSVDGYLQALDRAFGVLGLRFQDLLVVGLGVDGTNISAGTRASLYVAVQKTFPWILCLPMIHRPHLEVLDAISGKELSCLEDLETNLKQLLSFYRYSPRMMAELRCTAPNSVGGDGVPGRHQSHSEISSQTQRADAAAIALSLLQFLLDYQSVKLIYFLLDIIAVLSRLAFTFQGENHFLVSQVEAKIEDAILEIGQLVDFPGEYLQEFEENFRESFNGGRSEEPARRRVQVPVDPGEDLAAEPGHPVPEAGPHSRPFAKACRVLDLNTWPHGREGPAGVRGGGDPGDTGAHGVPPLQRRGGAGRPAWASGRT